MSAVAAVDGPRQRDDRYLRTLLGLLVSATFFEGYDGAILSVVQRGVQRSYDVAEAELGTALAVIRLGAIVAFFVTRLGDRIGRRRLLLVSVTVYTLATAATALAPNLLAFTLFQFVAQVFLGCEYATAVTMVVEEFPAARRGRAVGILTSFAALGPILVGLLLTLGVDQGPLEWRTLYLVGLLPLLLLAVLRRKVRETRRFELEIARTGVRRLRLLEPFALPYRRNLVLLGIVYLVRSIPINAATGWWAYFAETERGFTGTEVGYYLLFAYGLGVTGYVACGRLMERIGRRAAICAYNLSAFAFSATLFQTQSKVVAFFALGLGVFFGLGAAPAYSAMTGELFPTRVRAQAGAWARNIFDVGGVVIGLQGAALLADHRTGLIGNFGDTITLMLFLVIPGAIIIWFLPETKGSELDELDEARTDAAHELTGAGVYIP